MGNSMATLPDIDNVEARSEADDACFAEIRDVLDRHGALGRFGVTLLHQHFDIGDDELLVEQVDVDTRTLTIQPVSVVDVANRRVKETHWRLDTDATLTACLPVQHCYVDNKNDHQKRGGHSSA